MNKAFLFAFTCSLFLFFTACEDPTTVGSDLLDEDAFSLDAASDFSIASTTVPADKVPTYIEGVTNFNSYPIGKYSDPVFGTVESSLYIELVYNNYLNVPNMANSRIDSAVLVLSYDTTSTYGQLADIHNISVYEAKALPTSDTVYHNDAVEISAEPLGQVALQYKPKDSVRVVNYEVDTTLQTLRPQIRIPLDSTRFNSLFSNFDQVNTTLELIEKFKGLVIKSESNVGSLLGLNVGNTLNDGNNGFNGLYFYYRDSSNTKRVIKFIITDKRWLNFDSGFESGPYGHVMNNATEGKSLLFTQGFDGPDIKLVFKDLAKMKDKIINHAELEISAAVLQGDDVGLYPFVPQLTIGYKKNGQYFTITDISDLFSALIDIDEGFGGVLKSRTGTPNGTYRMNITKAVKDMLSGDIPNNELLISVQSRAQRSHRAVFYGAEHPEYPIKLKIAFTNP